MIQEHWRLQFLSLKRSWLLCSFSIVKKGLNAILLKTIQNIFHHFHQNHLHLPVACGKRYLVFFLQFLQSVSPTDCSQFLLCPFQCLSSLRVFKFELNQIPSSLQQDLVSRGDSEFAAANISLAECPQEEVSFIQSSFCLAFKCLFFCEWTLSFFSLILTIHVMC